MSNPTNDELATFINDAIAADPRNAHRIQAGEHSYLGALVGAVMKASKGTADAGVVRERVLAQLSA